MFAAPTVHRDLSVTHGDDKECWVEFYKQPIHMELESEQQGRPIYRDQDFITIQFPGDKTKKVVRPVSDFDKQRFPRQWQAFVEMGVVTNSGTPLEEWPALTRSQALELKGLGIHTVEQLANIGDHLLSFLGAREYRDQARKYIDKASGIDSRVSELEARNAELQEQLRAFMAERQQEPAADAPARKTRGPNKPKMASLNE